MARAIDKDYLLKHKRKVRFFGIGPDDESWGYAVPAEIIENAPTLTPPNEWVSVEDAVPDPGVRVLAANGSFVGEAYMASNGAWMRHDGFPWEVDAWMPMPDRRPPEGEEGDVNRG